MRVGDVLEWIAAVALAAAAYLWLGEPLALLTVGVCLAYFGQSYADVTWRVKLKMPQRRRVLGLPVGPPVAVFHCAQCGFAGPAELGHICSVAS